MARKPPVSRSITLPSIRDLRLLKSNPEILHDFMMDTLIVADKHRTTDIPDLRKAVRADMIRVFRERDKTDMKAILWEYSQHPTPSGKKYIEKLDSETDARLPVMIQEYGLLSLNIALVGCSRSAIASVLHPENKTVDYLRAQHLEEIYRITYDLMKALPLMYCNSQKITSPKRHHVQTLDLRDFHTLVEWLQSMISAHIRQSQEHIALAREMEKTQEKEVPHTLQVLIDLLNKAKEIFSRLFPQLFPPQLPSGEKMPKSMQIARDKMEHLHTALTVALRSLTLYPARPMLEKFNEIFDIGQK